MPPGLSIPALHILEPSLSGKPALAGDNLIGRLITGYRGAKVLFTAVSFDVFEQFRYSPRSSTSVAESLGWAPRACEVFLNALVAMDLLKKSAQGYANTEFAEQNLLHDSPQSLYHNLRFQDIVWDSWSQLPQFLRSPGHKDLVRMIADKRFVKEYINGMREIARQSAPEVADILAANKPTDILDVGAGSGSYSCALLDRCPGAKAVLMDLPTTLKFTKSLTAAYRRKLKFVGANYNKASLGAKAYDVVILSHVTHDEGEAENRRLVAKAFRALRPGGVLALHDFMLDESSDKPLFPALFSLQMLVYTKKGKTYSGSECEGWFQKAGFKKLQMHRICAGAENESTLLTGVKT